MNILDGIRKAITEGGMITVDLKEAAGLTGSGSGVGGNVVNDVAFSKLRQANPFREATRQITVSGSDAQFVARTGNAADATNPWLYAVTANSGSPDYATSIWQLPVRVITAQLPIRSAVLSDINGLQPEIAEDLMLEFSSLEAQSMATNNDQSGSSTTSTGGTSGLRGLDMYRRGNESFYGSSGTAITNGIHAIATVSLEGAAATYDKIVDIVSALPAQYWSLQGTAWHMAPDTIKALRKLKHGGIPLFLEVGDSDGAALGYVFGFPVIPNPYLSADFPIYLANWPRFMTIGDTEMMNIQMFDQTAPGFVTLYAEKRVVSSVRDPFACVRASAENPIDAVIDPDTGNFDLSSPSDVTTVVTFNDASILTSVINDVTALDLGTDYTFDGTTLTILSGYLSTLSVGDVPITINFNVGNPSTLTITITETP